MNNFAAISKALTHLILRCIEFWARMRNNSEFTLET